MRARRQPITPLAAVLGGLLAGAVGTVALDTVHYVRHRRAGNKVSPLAWELAPVDSWQDATDPGQVAKRLIEGLTHRELPDRWAFPVSTAAHWGYGSGWGMLYGVLAGSLRRPHAFYGVPFGVAVWAGDYAVLPATGLYKPIWEYDATTLAWDLAGHLAYGAGTGAAFWLFTTIWGSSRHALCRSRIRSPIRAGIEGPRPL